MSLTTLNPYPNMSTDFLEPMNAILASPPATVDELETMIADYIESICYTKGITPDEKIELKSNIKLNLKNYESTHP
jgi:hypothetical protein